MGWPAIGVRAASGAEIFPDAERAAGIRRDAEDGAMEESEKVVWQDKGSGVSHPAGWVFRWPLRDFFTGWDGLHGGVTPRWQWGVTPRVGVIGGSLILMANLIAIAWIF